jgi:hypothetical protein
MKHSVGFHEARWLPRAYAHMSTDVTGTNRYGELALELVARNRKAYIVRRLCRDRRARNVCYFRSSIDIVSNIGILYFLYGELIRYSVEYGVRRLARLTRGLYYAVESRTTLSLRRSVRLL